MRQPSVNNRSLRRLYRGQRFAGDLGSLVEPMPTVSRRLLRVAAIAALLALAAMAGWWLVPAKDRPVADRAIPETADDAPKLDTLELPVPAPRDASAAGTQRRPVLPGLLITAGPSVRSWPGTLPTPSLPSPPRLPSIHSDAPINEETLP